MARAAWLYHIGGLNQEATAKRLGITRARVNKLLSDARDTGLVSVTINPANVGLLPVEEAIRQRYGLDFCICTPALGHDVGHSESDAVLAPFAFRAVGAAAAAHLRRHLANVSHAVVGTGWGRTLEQMTLQLAGVSAPTARFISLMGSLTSNLAYNPFEVVHSFARTTGAEGFFLPVPFIADTPEVRDILLSQQSVQQALILARSTTVAYISLGELREESLLRKQGMISVEELSQLREAGAVGDTNGLFFDAEGRPVDHPLNRRTIALGFEDLARTSTVALVAGRSKLQAAKGFLASGIAAGLIIDGDTALELVAEGNVK
ncbi:MAG: DNA-binding transcriptional regulator [Cereibacter sphaeroides]|uniref:DNA-binding transcriptional regulator n=1 Tax=Cereibacter sphaeroides TaxID=1063 RepID=A0A2W5TYW9_CERSP|nr:MAG: DNA-binding transcriptional regulator [Cereibacter sphaeroides]